IGEDRDYLVSIWRAIEEKAHHETAPALLHRELERPLQILRDLFGGSVTRVVVEGESTHRRVLDFVESIAPRATGKVSLYTDPLPLFERSRVRREIERALRTKVWLKSGGSIVITQTEALVAVDVNTGKYTGRRNLEETIVKINLEAMREIARQLRLRDLGGIIVIDFIDMAEAASREALVSALEIELARDRAKTQLHELSDFGLVQITRKRARRSLERTLCRPCPVCRGSGRVKTVRTVAADILMEVRCALARGEAASIEVRAHPEVVNLIEAEHEAFIESLGAHAPCELSIHPDPEVLLEDFTVEADPC
ncbi:MAG: ribonuclease E/G, partial [Acidobacteriota bacterium]